jgi:signal recognition particle subunit SRP54
MLDALTQRLSNVVKTLRGHARLTEDNVQEMLREVRLALLDADAGLPVVKDFVARVKEQGARPGGRRKPHARPGAGRGGLRGVGRSSWAGRARGLDFATQPPAVILLAGPAGLGKTTSAGKLARLIRNTTKKKVLLVSTDVYRPAAIDQLADPREEPRDRPLPVGPVAEAGGHRARRPRLGEEALPRRAHRRHRGPPRIDEAMMQECASCTRR